MSEPLIGEGCDFWPDGTWKGCCDAHDVAFGIPGDASDWFTANTDLIGCVWQYSHLNAILIGIGVLIGSGLVFKFKSLGNKSIYQWITGKKY